MRTAYAHAPLFASLLLALSAAACGGDCAGVGRPAFEISVRDEVTGQGAAAGATLYVFKRPDLELVDSVVALDSVRILGAWDEDGRFDLLVELAGYWPWTAANVRVGTNESCSTMTA